MNSYIVLMLLNGENKEIFGKMVKLFNKNNKDNKIRAFWIIFMGLFEDYLSGKNIVLY